MSDQTSLLFIPPISVRAFKAGRFMPPENVSRLYEAAIHLHPAADRIGINLTQHPYSETTSVRVVWRAQWDHIRGDVIAQHNLRIHRATKDLLAALTEVSGVPATRIRAYPMRDFVKHKDASWVVCSMTFLVYWGEK